MINKSFHVALQKILQKFEQFQFIMYQSYKQSGRGAKRRGMLALQLILFTRYLSTAQWLKVTLAYVFGKSIYQNHQQSDRGAKRRGKFTKEFSSLLSMATKNHKIKSASASANQENVLL